MFASPISVKVMQQPVLWILLTASLAALSTTPTVAAEFLAGDAIQIEADQSIDGDLFVAAERVVMAGQVSGDVFVVAQSVEISGPVAGSLHIAAETITLASVCEGSGRIVGRRLILQPASRLKRDLMFTGESVLTEPESELGGDAYIAVAHADLQGTIQGTTQLASPDVTLGGHFVGDVQVEAPGTRQPDGELSSTVSIAETAVFNGAVKVRASQQPQVSDQATLDQELEFEPIRLVKPPTMTTQSWLRSFLIAWGEFFAVGLAFYIVLPGRTQRYLDNWHDRPVSSVVFGPVYWLLLLVGGILVLAATATLLVGLQVLGVSEAFPLVLGIGGVLVISLWGGGGLLGLFLSPVLTLIGLVRTALGRVPGFGRQAVFLPLLIGTLLLGLLVSIPLYGWLIWLGLALLGSGVFLAKHRSEPPPARSRENVERKALGKPPIDRRYR